MRSHQFIHRLFSMTFNRNVNNKVTTQILFHSALLDFSDVLLVSRNFITASSHYPIIDTNTKTSLKPHSLLMKLKRAHQLERPKTPRKFHRGSSTSANWVS
jgi:hypothetical protein